MQEKLFDSLYLAVSRQLLTTERSVYGAYAHSLLEVLSIDPCPRMKACLPQLVSNLAHPILGISDLSDEELFRVDDDIPKLKAENSSFV